MQVLDYEPQYWFLLRADQEYYLDVRCQRGFMDYTMLIHFTPEEHAAYQVSGHPFVATLASQIADAPTKYESRDLEKQLGERVTQAILARRATTGNGN